jgi:hypothetical protein
MTYEMAGRADKSGRVATVADGRFKVPVYFSDLTGDVSIALVAEDVDGRVSRASVLLHDGRQKPKISLVSPLGTFGSFIRVAGTVADPYKGSSAIEGIESVSWLLSPVTFSRTSAPIRGAVALGPDGTFRFSLPTGGLSSAQDLTVSATGRSGNRSELTIRLSRGDGDLPGFRLVPADGAVTVSWEPVPFAVRYDMSWSADGLAARKAGTMNGISSPVRLTGLDNGSRYTLQVKATFDDGSAGASPASMFIPLSPQTLVPLVASDYMQIRLSWKGIPGSDTFDVWRSARGAEESRKIAAAVSATSFVDAGVEFGRDYSYTISPAAALGPMSAPGSGRSLAFPAEKLVPIGSASFRDARRVTVIGGYAFVASGARGVRVIDVSTPTAPTQVGAIETSDAWDVAVRGSYAYVADGDSGLRVLDVAAPREPLLLGLRKTTDARAVVLFGAFAYVADGDKGLKVIDITDARDLPRVGQVDTVNALGLALHGERLYLADGAGGLKIYELKSGRPAPVLIGSLPTADARHVSVQGGIAAVADGAAGLRVVDVSNPSNPALLATFDTGMAASVALDAGFAYVADGTSGIKVISLGDPARPSLFASQAAPGAFGIYVSERLAYVADTKGLDVVRVQIQGRSFKVAACDTVGKAYDVSVSGDWAYVAAHAQGVKIVNVRDPASVSNGSLSASAGTRFAESVSVQDHFAYVADGSNGVRILDVAPVWEGGAGAAPIEVGSYRPGGTVRRVVPDGKYLYVAAGSQGVQVLDASVPSVPAPVSSVRTTDASDIVVNGNWAFVADGAGGILVIDVTDPSHPVPLPSRIRGIARRLALTGSLLVAAGEDGVRIVDVDDPKSPRVQGVYETNTAQSVVAVGGYAYVAEGYRGLTVLDLARPARPVVVSSCDSVFAVGVAVRGDFAVVVDSFGLRVIRILIPVWLAH